MYRMSRTHIVASGSTGLPARVQALMRDIYLCVSRPRNSTDGWAVSSFSYMIAYSCLFTSILISCIEFTGP
jgi:hypothetical protein